MPFLNASCSTFTTAGSMPFGPPIPNGEFETMSMPVSFSVGTLGQFLVRSAPQVTSRRNLPALTSSPQPVESAVAAVLDGSLSVDGAIESLLTRPLRAES